MDVSYFRTLLGVFLVMVVFVPTGLVLYSNAFEHSLNAMEAMDRLRPKFLLAYPLDEPRGRGFESSSESISFLPLNAPRGDVDMTSVLAHKASAEDRQKTG